MTTRAAVFVLYVVHLRMYILAAVPSEKTTPLRVRRRFPVDGDRGWKKNAFGEYTRAPHKTYANVLACKHGRYCSIYLLHIADTITLYTCRYSRRNARTKNARVFGEQFVYKQLYNIVITLFFRVRFDILDTAVFFRAPRCLMSL